MELERGQSERRNLVRQYLDATSSAPPRNAPRRISLYLNGSNAPSIPANIGSTSEKKMNDILTERMVGLNFPKRTKIWGIWPKGLGSNEKVVNINRFNVWHDDAWKSLIQNKKKEKEFLWKRRFLARSSQEEASKINSTSQALIRVIRIRRKRMRTGCVCN